MLRVIPRLHVVTDDDVLTTEDFRDVAESVIQVGGSVALHLRGPRTPARRLSELALALREGAAANGVKLIVNDRVDIALARELDGAHLGVRSLPPQSARAVLGPGPLLGASIHGAEEAIAAASGGVDYLFVGTLFESASHEGRPAVGPGLLGSVARHVDLPLIGIGGVTPAGVEAVLGAGGYGVAAIGGIWRAPSPADAVRDYLEALESERGVTTASGRETP